MDVKPLIKALDAGVQIILTGRCYNPWLAIHMGKILKYCAIACRAR